MKTYIISLFQKQNLHEFVYISIGRGDYSYIHSQTTKSGWPLYSGLQNYYITSQTNNCLAHTHNHQNKNHLIDL